MTSTVPAAATSDAFAERLFSLVVGAAHIQVVHLGTRLGYYAALAAADSLTAGELAAATGTHPRYAREWLEHQAAAGFVTVDDPAAAPGQRRFTLPAAHADVLVNADSLNFLAPLAQLLAATGRRVDDLERAYRTGSGVSWEQLGDDARLGQASANRPLFLGPLGRDYLPSIPQVHAALSAGGRVADVGCGFGWSAVGIARAYPAATVVGVDVDEPSLVAARANAEEHGVADRVRFAAGMPAESGTFDLVTAFECVHDMPDPVAVLAQMRRLVRPGGTVLVMDERTEPEFTAPAGEVEQMLYSYSVLCCLPDGMSHQPSVGTGTVMRPSTLAGYAAQAGFAGVEVLGIENDFFRFYRLLHG